MMMVLSKKTFLMLLPAVFLIVNIVLDSYINFFQIHNDYWDLLHIGRFIDFGNIQSLYNPCIPAGYCVVLHYILKFSQSVVFPIILNLLFGTATLLVSIFFYKKAADEKTAVASALLFCILPMNLYYFNQGGADPAAVFFFTSGTFLFLYNVVKGKSEKIRMFFFSGFITGVAALMRYHALAGAVMFLFCMFLFYRQYWKGIMAGLIGVFVAYLPQILINIYSGHGVFESKLGASNVYDLMYGINWYRLSTDPVPTDAFAVISSDYFLFFKKYVYFFLHFIVPTGTAALAVAFITKNTKIRKLALFTVVFMVLYFGFFSATLSGRQILIVYPLAMFFYGLLYHELFIKSRSYGVFAGKSLKIFAFLVIVCPFLFFIKGDIEVIKNSKREYAYSTSVSGYLKEKGCTSAFQTFTTDYGLSFVDFREPFGYFNGGWSRWGTYKYNETYPEFPVDSMGAFVETCHKRGVKYLLLTEDTRKVNDEFYRIYKKERSCPHIVFEKDIGRCSIFRVE